MNQRSADSPLAQGEQQGAIQVSLQRQGERLLKRYHYPHVRESATALERLSGWGQFSRTCPVVPRLDIGVVDLSSAGLTVEVLQERCRRLPHRTDTEILPHLDVLKAVLEQAWALGLVHGDLNRKNIWLTASGYRLVDIEPLLCIPLAGGGVYMRTTPPYLAQIDREQKTITAASDRLGWNCFSSWVQGDVSRPSVATSRFCD